VDGEAGMRCGEKKNHEAERSRLLLSGLAVIRQARSVNLPIAFGFAEGEAGGWPLPEGQGKRQE